MSLPLSIAFALLCATLSVAGVVAPADLVAPAASTDLAGLGGAGSAALTVWLLFRVEKISDRVAALELRKR